MIRKPLIIPAALLVAACTPEKNLQPQAAFSGPSSVRVEVAASFDASDSGDPDGRIVEWNYDFGDGSSSTGAAQVSHAWTQAGTFRVRLTVTDDRGGTAAVSRDVVVGENVPPVAMLSLPAGGRVNRDLSFDASASVDPDGTLADWSFDFGDQSPEVTGMAVAQHRYSAAGTYAVSLTVFDEDGASDTAVMQIAIADNLAPLASFTGPSSAVVGDPVGFDSSDSADSDGAIAARNWSFGDGATSELAAPVHAFGAAGTYTVSLSITDDEGKTGTFARQIAVITGAQANPAPVADFTSPMSVREDRSAYFDGSSSTSAGGSITAWNWSFGDGAAGSGTALGHTYADPGTYTASLTVTATFSDGSTSSNTASRSIEVTANQAPSVSLEAPASARVDRLVTFDASASSDADGSIASWTFDFGDGSGPLSGASSIVSRSYASAGTYAVTVTVTDNDGAASAATRSIVIEPNAAPVAALTLPIAGRVNRGVVVDASKSSDSDGTVASYAFGFGDGTQAIGTAASVSKTWTMAGSYAVEVTVTDDDGASAVQSKAIVIAPNQAPSAKFTGPTEAVVGDAAPFDGAASSDPDGTISSYTWDFGDATAATGAAVNKSYGAAGTYTVTLAVTDDEGASHATSRQVTVYTAAQAGEGPTAVLSAASSAPMNEPVDLDGSASGGGSGAISDYTFDFGDGSPVESGTAAMRVHSYQSPGTYTASLTVTSTYADGSTRSNSTGRQILVYERQVLIGSLSPASGTRSGGDTVLITGSGFTSASDTQVTFDGAPAGLITVLDPTRMTVIAPAGDPGTADVAVLNGNGGALASAAFTYLGDENEADASFCWIDASIPAGGADVGFSAGDDDANLGSAATDLPFDFEFLGAQFPAATRIRVASNGWLSFTDLSGAFEHAPIPSVSNPGNLIAPFFFDQSIGSGQVTTRVTGSSPNRRFTVQWDGVTDTLGLSERYRYQASLFEGSHDVKLQYANPELFDTMADGRSALIGIQNADGTDGLQLSRNQGQTGMAPGGRAVVFRRRDGQYGAQTETSLNVSSTTVLPGSRLKSDDSFSLGLSRSINTPTATANGSVSVTDLSTGLAIALVSPLQFTAAKDGFTATLSEDLVEGRAYRITVTPAVTDPLGNPLSQDPMGISCGALSPTSFTGDFLGSLSVATRIDLGGGTRPRGIAPEAGDARMFVSAFDGDAVLVLDVASQSVSATTPIAAGASPLGIAVTADRAITADFGTDAANRISTASLADGGELDLGGPGRPFGVAVNDGATRAYFATETNHVVAVNVSSGAFALCDNNGGAAGTALVLPSGATARAIAARPGDPGRYFVANANRFFVVNAVIGACDGTAAADSVAVDLGLGAGAGAYAMVATSSRAWVTEEGAHRVRVIDVDPASGTFGTILATVGLPAGSAPRGAALTGDGSRLAVALSGRDELTMIDTATLAEVDLDGNPANGTTRLTLPSGCTPSGVATVSTGTPSVPQTWVTCENTNEVLIVQ